MPSAGWTLDLARRWVAPARVRWRRWGLAAATVVALVVSFVGEGDRPCSVDDPTVCGPDATFSAAIALLAASVVLLWWRPWVAAACAVAFAALDLAYDDVVAARLVWPVVAALHVAHVWVLRREAQEQLALAARAATPVPPGWARSRPGSGSVTGSALPLAAALVLAAVAGGAMVALARAEAADRAHVATSTLVRAVVQGYQDDGLVRVRVEGPPAGVPAELALDSIDDHDAGDVLAVRVDPTDLGWSHPEAEPPDPTWWLTIATGAALLAALLAARVLVGRTHRGALSQHPPATGVPVRYALDEEGTALLVLPGADVVFGYVDLLPGPSAPLPQVAALADELRPGVLVGALRPGGWCALGTQDGLLLPDGPVSAEPQLLPLGEVEDAITADDPRSWTDPVPPDAKAAALPVVLGPSSLDRVMGVAAALAALALGLWVASWDDASWFHRLLAVALAAEGVHWGLDRALRGVWVQQDVVRTVSALSREDLPLWAVEEVRCTPTHVVLTFADDSAAPPGDDPLLAPGDVVRPAAPGDQDDDPMEGVLELGPFDPQRGRRSTGADAFPARSGSTAGPTAAEVAAALDLARVVRSAARAAGDAVEEHSRSLGPGVPWLVLAVAILAGRYLWVVLG